MQLQLSAKHSVFSGPAFWMFTKPGTGYSNCLLCWSISIKCVFSGQFWMVSSSDVPCCWLSRATVDPPVCFAICMIYFSSAPCSVLDGLAPVMFHNFVDWWYTPSVASPGTNTPPTPPHISTWLCVCWLGFVLTSLYALAGSFEATETV